MVDWLIERMAAALDMQSAHGKRTLVNEVVTVVRQLTDAVEREHYVGVLAERTATSKETIAAKLDTKQASNVRLKRVKKPAIDEAAYAKEQRVREQHLLAICMKHASIGALLSRIPIDVFSPEAQPAASYITQHPGVTPVATTGDQSADYGTMLTLLYEESYQHTGEDELRHQAKNLVSRLVQTYAKMKKAALVTEMAAATETEQNTLLLAVKQLDDLVTQFAK